MSLTPEEQAALDALSHAPDLKVGTAIHRFETKGDYILISVPVPRGPNYWLGQGVTITFEEA